VLQPENYEATKVLASLYAQTKSQSQQKKAQELFASITKKHPEDIEAWIELAVLKEQHEPQVWCLIWTSLV
jgi:cytochrome c-type biogenesis protein CcmH/NrfG